MPKVPELDWSKLKPKEIERKLTHGGNPDGIYWRYKKKEPPKSTSKKHGKIKRISRRKKPKVLDKTIYDFHDNATVAKLKNIL